MTHEFTINNRSFLTVSVPEESVEHEVLNDGSLMWKYGIGYEAIDLPEGNYKLIGLYPGMSEEQAASIVEDCPHYAKCWKNYCPKSDFKNWDSAIFNPNVSCWTALESFASKMAAEKLYTENPEGLKPDINSYPADREGVDNYLMDLGDWQDAEDLTSKMWVIIEKI